MTFQRSLCFYWIVVSPQPPQLSHQSEPLSFITLVQGAASKRSKGSTITASPQLPELSHHSIKHPLSYHSYKHLYRLVRRAFGLQSRLLAAHPLESIHLSRPFPVTVSILLRVLRFGAEKLMSGTDRRIAIGVEGVSCTAISICTSCTPAPDAAPQALTLCPPVHIGFRPCCATRA